MLSGLRVPVYQELLVTFTTQLQMWQNSSELEVFINSDENLAFILLIFKRNEVLLFGIIPALQCFVFR